MPWTRNFASPILAASSSKTRMNSAPIALRLASGSRQALQPREEALLRVDGHQRHVELVAERGDDLLALVLAHHPVVDEHARELIADRLVDQQRGDGRVDAAREPADDLAVADLGADRRDLLVDDVRRAPGARAAADVRRGTSSGPAGRTGVCTTSGWNWMPYSPRATSSSAATGDSVEDASAVKPSGAAYTVSRCDIQHACESGVPASSRPGSATVSCERPNSPTSAPSTRPPSVSTSACIP